VLGLQKTTSFQEKWELKILTAAAEGAGGTRRIDEQLEANTKAEVRLSIMCGQRGGSPTARSRLLANLSPKETAGLLPSCIGGRVVGLQKGEVKSITLEEVCSKEKPNDLSLLEAAKTLAAQAKQRRGGGKLQRACLLAASRLRLILLLLLSFLFLGFLLLRQAASPLGACPKMKVGLFL
jgi:hypothetical protein